MEISKQENQSNNKSTDNTEQNVQKDNVEKEHKTLIWYFLKAVTNTKQQLKLVTNKLKKKIIVVIAICFIIFITVLILLSNKNKPKQIIIPTPIPATPSPIPNLSETGKSEEFKALEKELEEIIIESKALDLSESRLNLPVLKMDINIEK